MFVLLGMSLIWATPRWKPAHAGLLALGCIALPIAAGIAAFVWRRLLFDVAAPALALLVLFSVLLLLTLAEASRQRRTLERAIRRQREEAAYVAGELQAAKRIQLGFLPRADLLRDDPRIEIAASMIPAQEVGGDLYDYFRLDDKRLFFLIGDVAGKGLSASLFMAVSKALYKSTTLRNPRATVGDLMQAANDEVSRDNPEMFFVTAFAGVLDLDSGALAYCNAGHVNPYLFHPARGEFVRLTDGAGPPLCTVDRFDYRSGDRRMRPGELICLVTDGVVDAQNPERQRYGSDRLQVVMAAQVVTGQRRAHWSTRCAPMFACLRRTPSLPMISRCWRCDGWDRGPDPSRHASLRPSSVGALQRTRISTLRLRGSATPAAVGTASARFPREIA